jgi:hypothetical protein
MKNNVRRLRRLCWLAILVMFILAAAIFIPGPINECYLEAGDYFNTTEGHSFSYLADGHVFSCNEYSDKAVDRGAYQYEKGIGWVWTLRKIERRVLVKPHLLFITFTSIEGIDRPATAPFQWRDPCF